MVKTADQKDYVQSLDRGLAVILAFADRKPRLSLAELAASTGLSRPTVRRILITLEQLGYVRADARTFSLTPHVLALGNAYLSSLNLTEIAQPVMEELTRQTGHTSSLAGLDGMDAIFLLRVPARQVMATMLISGTRVPAYASAIGRVLLAELPDHDLDHFLDTVDLAPVTALTVTDSGQLRQTLADARKQGWAMVDQELEEGVRSVAAPIRDATGRPIAALGMSVAARTVSLDDLHADYLPAIVGAAADISKRLGATNAKERHA